MLGIGLKHNFNNTSVKFSIHKLDLIAVTSAMNFGIVGSGMCQVFIFDNNTIKQVSKHNLQVNNIQKDAIFDLSWTQHNPNLIIIGGGNGLIQFWDYTKGIINQIDTKNQISSIQCSFRLPLFISTKGVIRIGDILKGNIIDQMPAHKLPCNQGIWHPISDHIAASVGSDGLLILYDYKLPKKIIASIKVHQQQALSCDFSKYDQHIATSSKDKSIRIWDLRKLSIPLNILYGHRYPIKKVKYSPHFGNIIASASYDMNVNIYDISDIVKPLKFCHSQHSQFVTGIDFNLYNQKLLASGSWDGRVIIWPYDKQQPIIT